MQCPECQSTHIRKNGIKRGKQNHICVDCGRQFIEHYETSRGYSNEVKQECLKMYVNGMGFRGIERSHCVFIIRRSFTGSNKSASIYPMLTIQIRFGEVGELDELETFVGAKKTKSGRQEKGGSFPPFLPSLDGGRPLHVRDFRRLCWATIVPKPLPRCGRSLSNGSATSMLRMVGVFIRASFQTAIRLSVRPI